MPGKCPTCGAQRFYTKDAEDQYNISSFSLETGALQYLDEEVDEDRTEVVHDSEVFCERCAWHGQYRELKTP